MKWLDKDTFEFENLYHMEERLLVHENRLHEIDKALLETIFLMLVYSPEYEVEFLMELHTFDPTQKRWVSAEVPVVVYVNAETKTTFNYGGLNEDETPKFCIVGISSNDLQDDISDFDSFVLSLMHELGHMMFQLKYRKTIDEKTKNHDHHCDKTEEKFSDTVALVSMQSIEKFKATIQKIYKNMVVSAGPHFENYVCSEAVYRAKEFDKAIEKYPEKFRALGIAC